MTLKVMRCPWITAPTGRWDDLLESLEKLGIQGGSKGKYAGATM